MSQHSPEIDDIRGEMNLREILTDYVDHDGLGWPAMFAYLRTYDARKIADLTASVVREGFKEPIYLGPGVVLDGLHRLAVAEALDWRMLPVEHADPEDVADMDLPSACVVEHPLLGHGASVWSDGARGHRWVQCRCGKSWQGFSGVQAGLDAHLRHLVDVVLSPETPSAQESR